MKAIKNTDSTTVKPKIELAPIVEVKTLYTKEKDIEAALLAANKSTKAIEIEYQRIAVSLLQHLNKHGDIRIIRNFFGKPDAPELKKPDANAYLFPASMFKESMAVFMEQFGQVTFSKELEDGKYIVKPMFDKEKTFNLDGALKNHWYKAAKQAEYKGFNELDKLGQLLALAKKKVEKPSEKDFVTAEFVADLEAFYKDQQFKVKRAQEKAKVATVETTKEVAA